MSRGRKILIVCGALFSAGLTILVILISSVDPDEVRSRLEKRFSEVAGFQVEARGGIEIHFLPPAVSVRNLVLLSGADAILQIPSAKAGFAILPLLRRDVRMHSLTLRNPRLTVPAGGLELPQERNASMTDAPFAVDEITIEQGAIRYAAPTDEVALTVAGLELSVHNLRRDDQGSFSISGRFSADECQLGEIVVNDLEGSLSTAGGDLLLESLDARLYGSRVEGRVQIQLADGPMRWQAELDSTGLSLTKLFQSLTGQSLFEGTVEMHASLQGAGAEDFFQLLSGNLQISGTEIIQHGFSLDRTINNLRASRSLVDFVDIGLFAFAGPVGLLVSKGADVAGLISKSRSDERQVIEKFVFDWTVDQGIARTEDVALRTNENRLALKGAIDLAEMRYLDMELALLNSRGCAELTESIHGRVTRPEIEQTGVLGSLAGSLTGVVKQGLEILDFSECTPFYKGKVVPKQAD